MLCNVFFFLYHSTPPSFVEGKQLVFQLIQPKSSERENALKKIREGLFQLR